MWRTHVGLIALSLLLASGASDAAQTRVAVSVRMLGEFGEEPLAGAVVRFLPDTLGAPGTPVASARTDLNGLAALAVPNGRYVVTASAEGFQTGRSHTALVGNDAVLGFVLEFADPSVVPEVQARILSSATVSGRLLTLDGAPLLAAAAFLSANGVSGSTTHAEDGTFRAVAPVASSGTYTLRVTPSHVHVRNRPPVIFVPDIDEYSISVPAVPDREIAIGDIRLPAHPEFRLRVTVTDGTGRTPPDAQVELFRPPTSVTYTNREGRIVTKYGPRGSSGLRDADGVFNFGPLPSGPVTVYAVDDRLNPQLAAMANVEVQAQGLNEVHLELLPGARISGRVEFAGRTRPLQGGDPLRVQAWVSGEYGYSSNDPGLVGEDGSFQIGGLVGRRCLRVHGLPGWRVASINHAGRDVTYVPFDLELGQEIRVDILVVPGERHSEPRCELE
jgi:hypothetical protein